MNRFSICLMLAALAASAHPVAIGNHGSTSAATRSNPMNREAESDYRIVRNFILRALSASERGGDTPASGEYAQHLAALGKLTVEIAEAMPENEYDFRPDPPSMTFGEQMAHVARTNYAYCAGLSDTEPPAAPQATGRDAVIKYVSDSFTYCAGIIPNLTEKQLSTPHASPDGRLPGREILLVMYVHVAHHRGQAEVYLRDKGIKPPRFTF
jgi:uncharacterized damage-inducible protein DinB